MPSGSSTAWRSALGDALPAASPGDQLAEVVEPRVGVDAPGSRPGQDRLAFERQAGGMGQQVADGGAGWAGGFIEVDVTRLDRPQHRKPGDELGRRRPAEWAVRVTVDGEDAVGTNDGRGRVRRSPAIDRGKGDAEPVGHGSRC